MPEKTYFHVVEQVQLSAMEASVMARLIADTTRLEIR